MRIRNLLAACLHLVGAADVMAAVGSPVYVVAGTANYGTFGAPSRQDWVLSISAIVTDEGSAGTLTVTAHDPQSHALGQAIYLLTCVAVEPLEGVLSLGHRVYAEGRSRGTGTPIFIGITDWGPASTALDWFTYGHAVPGNPCSAPRVDAEAGVGRFVVIP